MTVSHLRKDYHVLNTILFFIKTSNFGLGSILIHIFSKSHPTPTRKWTIKMIVLVKAFIMQVTMPKF